MIDGSFVRSRVRRETWGLFRTSFLLEDICGCSSHLSFDVNLLGGLNLEASLLPWLHGTEHGALSPRLDRLRVSIFVHNVTYAPQIFFYRHYLGPLGRVPSGLDLVAQSLRRW